MAQKVNIVHVSDLSGSGITDNDAPTIAFSYDGTDYTIDLTAKEAERFYKDMEKYLNAATKVGRAKGGRKSNAKASDGPKASDVRAWAKENGHTVPDRGRIPAEVVEAYSAAH